MFLLVLIRYKIFNIAWYAQKINLIIFQLPKDRQMMVQEFRMSSELVMSCAQEIDKLCSPSAGDLESEGKTIHCLMKVIMLKFITLKIYFLAWIACEPLVCMSTVKSFYILACPRKRCKEGSWYRLSKCSSWPNQSCWYWRQL